MHEELTTWITLLKEGDPRSHQEIWNTYFQDLVTLTRQRMAGMRKRDFDEEDVAISAFQSFFRAFEENRIPKLDDRTDLWKVLIVIAARKLSTQRKRLTADKRGGGKVRGESVFVQPSGAYSPGLEQVLGREPSPDFSRELADTFEHFLRHLADGTLRRIATLKLEGLSNAEIAKQLGCVERTVERKIERIRASWTKLHAEGDRANESSTRTPD